MFWVSGKSTESYINLGFVYIARNDYADAVRYFQKALESEPGNHDAINSLGYVYEKMGRFGSAKRIYEQALILHPENVETIINEDKFKDLYDDDNGKGGRPNKSIKTVLLPDHVALPSSIEP